MATRNLKAPGQMNGMPEPPKKTWRRWLQFRLSTWLILVAIVALAMAMGPYKRWEIVLERGVIAEELFPPVRWNGGVLRMRRETLIGRDRNQQSALMSRKQGLDLGRLALPVLALAALIGWKVFARFRKNRARLDVK